MRVILDYSKNEQEFDKYKRFVLAKILKECGLQEAPKIPDKMAAKIGASIESYIQSDQWQENWIRCAEFSCITLDGEQMADLNKKATEIMQDLIHAYYVRDEFYRILQVSCSSEEDKIKRDLPDIYINHITREALSKMHALGFTSWSAVTLAGKLINKSITRYRESAAEYGYNFSSSTYVEPIVGGIRSKEDAEDAVNEISNLYRILRDEINVGNKANPHTR